MKVGWLIALFTSFGLLAVTLPACGASEDHVTVVGASPQEKADAVNLDDVHSGELLVSFLTQPPKGEPFEVRLAARFQGLGEASLPRVLLSSSSHSSIPGHRLYFTGSLLLLSNQAVLSYGHAFHERSYGPSHATFEGLKAKFEEAQNEDGEGDVMACLEAAHGVELTNLIRNLKSEGHSEDADGTHLFVVAGDIDIPRLAAAMIHLAEDRSCGAQMMAVGLPSATELTAAETMLERRIEEATIRFAVDERGTLRELSAFFSFENSPGLPASFAFTWRLVEVNSATPLLPPGKERPLDIMLRRFGTSEAAVLQAEPGEFVLGFLKGLSARLTGRLP